MQIFKVYGPPGCGKTTTLLDTVEAELAGGVEPDKIAFVSFTRRAVKEAIDRAVTRFGFSPDDLRYFRTLHSLCYRQCDYTRGEVLGRSDMQKFGELIGMDFASFWNNEDGPPDDMAGTLLGDHYQFVYDLHRNAKVPLEDAYRDHAPEEMLWPALERYTRAYSDFKVEVGKNDFTDMLLEYSYGGPPTEAEVAIIDEAQDLTPLQWNVVERAFANVKRLYIAGDDDQCIYSWCGADVAVFQQYPGEQRVLSQSYRVPRAVQAFAGELSTRIRTRVEKHWKPRDAEGHLQWHHDLETVDMSQGTWMVLARNAYHLKKLEDAIRADGMLYETRNGSGVNDEDLKAIRGWLHLAKGGAVSRDVVGAIYKALPSGPAGVKRGYKKVDAMDPEREYTEADLLQSWGLQVETTRRWDMVFTRIPQNARLYYRALLRRGEKLDTPRIMLSTIHGVKGGEADNVLLCTDVTKRTHAAVERSDDAEHRVWYVAATRARHALHILFPTSTMSYDV